MTITKYGTHEQWVFSHDRYVYFDDDIVSRMKKCIPALGDYFLGGLGCDGTETGAP